MVREKQQRFDDAIAAFRRVVALDPKHAEAYNYIGYMYAERGQNLPEAVELIQKALELDPENGYFIDSLGWAYYQQGKYAEALRELQRAAERAKDDPEIFDHLADAYVKNGKVEEAIAAWEKAVSVDKDNRLGDGVKKKLQEAREKQLRAKGESPKPQDRNEVARADSPSFSLCLALGACASAAAPRAPRPRGGGRARRGSRTHGAASGISAAWPTSRSGRAAASQRLSGVLLLKAPAAFRFEALSPFGPPLLVVAGSPESVTVWEVLRNRAYLLPSTPEANRRWLGLALSGEDLVALLAGHVRPMPAPRTGTLLPPDETGASLRLSGSEGTQRIWLDRGRAARSRSSGPRARVPCA